MNISVALIVYNGANYMRTQLDSILAQTHKVDEIIVVEDASTDNTIEILNNYSKENPELFFIQHNEKNIGSYKSIEKSIKACTGDIIILADHDDYWETHKVGSIIKWFEENPKIDGLMTNGLLIDAKGEINSNYFLWDSMCFPYKNITNTEDLRLYINTIENCATGAAMAFRNNLSFLQQPFPVIKYFIHDRWLAINLAEQNSLGILDEKLIRYRIHPTQETGGRKDEIEKYIEINKNLFAENIQFETFKELRYILNKIEINLHIQNEIKKISYKEFDNQKYIDILKNKHSIFLNTGIKKWPILSFIRIIKKIIRPVASQ
jgi:glycosyltransferase involved in cell wall biosynthesis